MKTIAFCSAKGGVGKTSLAISIAVAAQESGERVYAIDTDPQASLLHWGERREADDPGVDQCAPSGLEDALATLRRAKYSLVVVDTRGTDEAGSAIVMRLASLVVVPFRPFAIDYLAITPTTDAIDRLKKRHCIVINGATPRVSARITDATETFAGKVGPVIVNRFSHPDAVARGLGVTEFEPSGLAATEIRELWSFLKERL